jgi:hypothetical protein
METPSQLAGAPAALMLLADAFEFGLSGLIRDRLAASGVELGVVLASEDDEAARHEGLLGFSVPPYAGVFMNPDGLIGGVAEARAAEALLKSGIDPRAAGSSGDHISGLTRATALVMTTSNKADAAGLAVGLLGWLPALELALRREGGEDYADLVNVLEEVLIVVAAMHPEAGRAPEAIEDREVPTARSESGVKDLAEYLSSHALTGVYLGRGTVQRIARRVEAPRGFGGRALMLANLLKSAAAFDRLDEAIGLIREEVVLYQEAWQLESERHPSAAKWAVEWSRRQERTLVVLEAVQKAVHAETEVA